MNRLILVFLSGCVLLGCSRGSDGYGGIEFSSVNGSYAAYIIEKPGSKLQLLPPKEFLNPLGLGGVITVPKCYRWGLILFTPLDFEQFIKDATAANLPELKIVDNGHFDEERLSRLKDIVSLRRLDLRTCSKVSDAVLSSLASNQNLKEIWLREKGKVTESGIKSIVVQYPHLAILYGESDSIMGSIAEGRSTTNAKESQ